MLQINVSQLLKAPIGSIRDYQVSEVTDIADGSGLIQGEITDIADGSSLIQGEVRLLRVDRGILVKGTLHTEIELTCSRCLSLFSCPLTLGIEEEYYPTTNVVTGAPLPPPDDSDRFPIDENNILDLTEAIRQYALLVIPMKPLCREDCAGLCPTCGCNLNQAPCKCPTQTTDPRWSVLSKLF